MHFLEYILKNVVAKFIQSEVKDLYNEFKPQMLT